MMNPMLDKVTQILSKLGVSTDTISKVTDEASNKQPEVTVTKVAVAVTEDKPLTDDEINKMTEQEAKDYIKKMRDEDSKEEDESSCDKPEKKISNTARLSQMPDMSRVM